MTKSIGVIGGVIAGGLTCILFFTLYKINPELMLSSTTYWGSTLIYLLVMLLALLRVKGTQGGVLPFRQALQIGFTTFVIANLLFFAFYYYLFTTDLSLLDIQVQQSKDFAETLPTGTQGKKELMSLTAEDIKVTLGGIITKFAYGALGGFLISALLAVLVKQEK